MTSINTNVTSDLIDACAKGSLKKAESLLLKCSDIDIQNELGINALFAAVRYNHTDLAIKLIQRSQNVNLRVKTGEAPIHWAILNKARQQNLWITQGSGKSPSV